MKRILSLGLAALMTVFALAGCGADNGGKHVMGLDHIRLLPPDQPPDFLHGEGSHGKIGNVSLFQGLPDGAFRAAVVHIDFAPKHGNDLADHIFRTAEGVPGKKMQDLFPDFHGCSSLIQNFPLLYHKGPGKESKKSPGSGDHCRSKGKKE